MRRIGRGLAVAAGLVLLALLLGTLIRLGPSGPPSTGEGRHRILVLANAIHTDIALPVDAHLLARFPFLQAAGLPTERADWLIVGRGGRSFYIETPSWGDLRPWPVVKAFTRDDAVMHVALAGPLDAGEAGSRAFDLDDAAYEALLAAIEEGFAETAAIPGAGYGPYDRFFAATGSFNALVGCNVWTAATLRKAGIATGLWTPLPPMLRWSLDWHGDASALP